MEIIGQFQNWEKNKKHYIENVTKYWAYSIFFRFSVSSWFLVLAKTAQKLQLHRVFVH